MSNAVQLSLPIDLGAPTVSEADRLAVIAEKVQHDLDMWGESDVYAAD